MNVIIAYEEVEDDDFIMYVKNKRSLWEEGQTTLDLNSLMTQCENTYKIRQHTGKWKAPSRQAEQFAAMKAEWEKTHNINGNKNNQNNGANKSKYKLPYAERMKQDKEMNPWKWIPLKDGEMQSKEHKGTTYHWCANHKKWLGHSTAECIGVGVNVRRKNVTHKATDMNDDTSNLTASTNNTNATPTVQVNNALLSLASGGIGLFE
jgi:hypothetical protein